MNIFFIIKSSFILIFYFFLTSCGTKNIYEKILINDYDPPTVESLDESKIILFDEANKEINYEKKLVLKNFKNDNPYFKNIEIINNQIFAINNKFQLLNFDINSGDIISNTEIKFPFDNEKLISFNSINDFFIIALKTGTILCVDINGQIIWENKYDKILNTPLKVFDKQIIIVFGDEIKSILYDSGVEVWSEKYEDLPLYQAQGGQLYNFLNLIYFILPNNKIGSIDLSLGSIHNSKFDEIPIISSINNTKDKIYIYKNYLIYLDEGKYLYTFDIFDNEYIVFKKNINSSKSNIIFNNSIILKNGNFLQAINIFNNKTFWIIEDKNISKNASIIGVRNHIDSIEIFLDNGDILEINNKKINSITNMDVGKIMNISLDKKNIIVQTKNKKTIIF